jgi:hypothetical protein
MKHETTIKLALPSTVGFHFGGSEEGEKAAKKSK